jgi:uncharacterized membrane protein
MPSYCPSCGTQIDVNATTCPACGKTTTQPVGLLLTDANGLADNIAGALAYVTFIPALIFLLVEPYSKRRFVRFHAFQSLFFHIAWTVLWVALRIVAAMPVLGWTTLLLWPLIGLGGFILWLVLVMKAYGGQTFKLPVIGQIAEQQAGPAPPPPTDQQHPRAA